MKKLYLAIAVATIAAACGNAETKAKPENLPGETKGSPADTVISSPEKLQDVPAPQSGTSRGLSETAEPSDILANIDRHLVSKAAFSIAANGGITNGVVTVENTLPDVTFQKAIIEVSIRLADGKEYRTDYYTVQNLEPGGKKTVKMPNTTRGDSVHCQVVKLKSQELTKGEMILVGSRYVPGTIQ